MATAPSPTAGVPPGAEVTDASEGLPPQAVTPSPPTPASFFKTRIDAVAHFFPPLADDVADPPPPPQATTIVYGYGPENNVLILEDENDTEVFTKYDAINRSIAVRVFRSEGNPPTRPPDSHVGDPIFAPNPVNDFRGTPRGSCADPRRR